MIWTEYSHKKNKINWKSIMVGILSALQIGCSNMKIFEQKSISQGGYLWTNQNLKVKRFSNGEKIPHLKSSQSWEAAGENKLPGYCKYKNKFWNGWRFGYMYNFYALADPRGISPDGWTIPNEEQFDLLFKSIDSQGDLSNLLFNKRIANKLGNKFLLKPGGFRSPKGSFENKGIGCPLWSCTQNENGIPLSYHLVVGKNEVIKSYQGEPQGGGYIRLIKEK